MIEVVERNPDLALTVNGSKLAVGARPRLEELEPALRSVALSDSPVFVRAPSADHEHLLDRLHRLGRRSNLPLYRCRSLEEARALLDITGGDVDGGTQALGTWALFEVETWPEDRQEKLGELLECLDLARLHGRLRHERIPRVIVFSPPDSSARLSSSLDRRISYFTLVAEPHLPKEQ